MATSSHRNNDKFPLALHSAVTIYYLLFVISTLLPTQCFASKYTHMHKDNIEIKIICWNTLLELLSADKNIVKVILAIKQVGLTLG